MDNSQSPRSVVIDLSDQIDQMKQRQDAMENALTELKENLDASAKTLENQSVSNPGNSSTATGSHNWFRKWADMMYLEDLPLPAPDEDIFNPRSRKNHLKIINRESRSLITEIRTQNSDFGKKGYFFLAALTTLTVAATTILFSKSVKCEPREVKMIPFLFGEFMGLSVFLFAVFFFGGIRAVQRRCKLLHNSKKTMLHDMDQFQSNYPHEDADNINILRVLLSYAEPRHTFPTKYFWCMLGFCLLSLGIFTCYILLTVKILCPHAFSSTH